MEASCQNIKPTRPSNYDLEVRSKAGSEYNDTFMESETDLQIENNDLIQNYTRSENRRNTKTLTSKFARRDK
jgi:hypothetical protein